MSELSKNVDYFMVLSASEQADYIKDNPYDALRIIWWLAGKCDGLSKGVDYEQA